MMDTANSSEAQRAAGAAEAARQWLEEFKAAARRPLRQRFRYAFIKTYKPVLDDASYRSFDTMADYRRWCEENLPDWLGYGRV
jgi:hypothetical protein